MAGMTDRTFSRLAFISACSVLLLTASQQARAQNRTTAGALLSPYPTLQNIALEWHISRDDDLDGVVAVSYRKKGVRSWKEAMQLRRVPAGENVRFQWRNKHAGSIFDLNPGTLYEIRLILTDPDGGNQEETIEVRTRPEPAITQNAEIIDIAPGVYDTLVTKSGTSTRPVVYRSKGGIAIFKHIDLSDKQWIFIEGLVVDNITDRGVGIRMNGASNCVVRRCIINSVYGIVAYKPGATNC